MKKKNREINKSFQPEPLDKKTLRYFSDDEHAINALSLGSAVFQLEQATKTRRIKNAVFPIYGSKSLRYDLDGLSQILQELLVFTLAEDITIDFKKLSLEGLSPGRETVTAFKPTSKVCLFSGGTDSYAGVLQAANQLPGVQAVFCAHSDQARIIHIVQGLQKRLLAPAGIQLHKQLVPGMGARGYAQLRGFLYLLSAAGWLDRLQAAELIVTECGPTMYQPRFSPLDAVTMTTHPRVVRLAALAINLLLQRNVEVVTPFENLTKAEVIAISPLKSGLKFTHSCVTQRFGNHDGTCYGCVLRRLATTAADVEDVKYLKNPIAREATHCGNLLTLLRFSLDLLTAFEEMEEYEVGTITYYGKRDLFNRFALDNFAAIHRLIVGRHLVQRGVRRLYESAIAVIGVGVLEDRLNRLQASAVAPRF